VAAVQCNIFLADILPGHANRADQGSQWKNPENDPAGAPDNPGGKPQGRERCRAGEGSGGVAAEAGACGFAAMHFLKFPVRTMRGQG